MEQDVKLDAEDVIRRLCHAITTASNDDMSEPGGEKRKRHIARIDAMADATTLIQELRSARR